MSNVLVNDTSLTAIANAIRSKLSTSNTYKPGQMASAIQSIPTGGGATGGLANMVDITDADISFGYMLSAMKNGDTAGGTITYTSAFANTETKILSTGLSTIHGIMFAPTAYDTKTSVSSAQTNKFVVMQLYDDEVPTKYLIYGFSQNNAGSAKNAQTLDTLYQAAPENGAINIIGGDIYYRARYNKNANYQLLMVNETYEWLAW